MPPLAMPTTILILCRLALSPPPLPLPPAQSEDFDRTGGLMGGTLARLDGLVKSAGGSGHVCKLIGFVVVVFLLLYWLLARK